MRGILLAGGRGTRLGPLTVATSKQLLPVFDKPLIYYSLSTLMLAGIREVLIITTKRDLNSMKAVLGSGQEIGMSLSYAVQDEPRGIAEALIIGKDYFLSDGVCLALGDNIFFGAGLGGVLRSRPKDVPPTVFAIESTQPWNYAVVTFSKSGEPVDIIEKPDEPSSAWVVPGLYFYPSTVGDIVSDLRPSARGELEITDLNQILLRMGLLTVVRLPRGTYWIDAGTPDALVEASQFAQLHFRRTGQAIACLEEIAFRMGWIDALGVAQAAQKFSGSDYSNYAASVIRRSN